MEALLAKGKVKAIGVSNFSEILLKELEKTWKVVPAVNQVSDPTDLRYRTFLGLSQIGIRPLTMDPLAD
jgi:diketogulonate reductase-like aldo/keto reductase